MHPTNKGDLAEAAITIAFLRRGWVVLRPITQNSRYDLVIDRGVGFERIQCKTGRARNGTLRFNTVSSHYHRGGSSKGYRGQADLFGIYCPELDTCYLIPVEDVPVGKAQLRLLPPKTKIAIKGHPAEFYKLQ